MMLKTHLTFIHLKIMNLIYCLLTILQIGNENRLKSK